MKSIRRIILEMSKAILEVKEHTDDEIVDFDEIDLQDEYNKLNNLIFGGKLKPVEMMWNTRRSAHGIVKAQRKIRTGEIIIKSLAMSKFLDVPYKVFKDTLAHEMIHVFLLQQGINDGHGHRFQREMNRINSMGLGFRVALSIDFHSFSISKHGQKYAKEQVFFLVDTDTVENVLIVTSPKIYQSNGDEVKERFEALVKNGKISWAKGEIYKSSNPELLKYMQNRTFRSISYDTIEQSRADELKSKAELIDSFSL